MHFNGLKHQRGNIFAALFGATALVGVLGAAAMNTLAGPVSTVQRVTQKNIAQNNLMLSARILISAAEDADADGLNEPPAYRAAGVLPAPAGGGLLPDNLGLALTDPWGVAYGLCVWDHGATNASANRLNGDNTGAASTQMLLAVVSAGPDRAFETTCAAYSGGPVSIAVASGSDDVIFKYSYAEAAAASGGLWTLNTTDANTAELADGGGAVKISADRAGGIVSSVGVVTSTLSASASANDTLQIAGGLRLDDGAGSATVCAAGQKGAVRLSSTHDAIEICDGASAFIPLRASPPDGDKGDISVTANGDTWEIDPGAVGADELAAAAVTFVKMQDIATNRLLGRSSAGAGSVEQLSIGAGLSLSGGVLSATPGAQALDDLTDVEFTALQAGDVLTYNGAGWVNGSAVMAEVDPKVGTLTNGKWCRADGTKIECDQDAPEQEAVTFKGRLGTTYTTNQVPLKFTTEVYDTANAHDPATGGFTAPTDGLYLVVVKATLRSASGADPSAQLRVNGVTQDWIISTLTTITSLTLSTPLVLSAGDVVDVTFNASSGGGTGTVYGGSFYTTFSITKI